jgi:hypothetical protein
MVEVNVAMRAVNQRLGYSPVLIVSGSADA